MSTSLRLTVAEYDRMIESGAFDEFHDRRIELVYGELREMTPPGPSHEVAIDFLAEWSFDNVPRKQVWVRVQNSVGLPALDSAPQPDIGWVERKDYRAKRPQSANVLLLIEVSDSSLAYDRGVKAGLYAQAGIADYWVVNLRDFCIEVFRDPQGTAYRQRRVYGIGESISPLAFPDLSLSVSDLFSRA